MTWTPVGDGTNNFYNIQAFGFGAPFSTYPTVYCAGALGVSSTQWGIYMSKDNAVTWTKLTDYPAGVICTPVDLDGDKTTPGQFYGCTAGQGAFYYG